MKTGIWKIVISTCIPYHTFWLLVKSLYKVRYTIVPSLDCFLLQVVALEYFVEVLSISGTKEPFVVGLRRL